VAEQRWRISIQWDFISPALETISGVITMRKNPHEELTADTIFYKIKVSKQLSGVRYDAIEEGHQFPNEWDAVKEKVDDIVDAYYAGMRLRNSIYYWTDIQLTTSLNCDLIEDERTYSHR
jgi:hypothetical protein